MVIIYGIPNCDTMKKAMTWLKTNNIAFEFHDYKKQGISTSKLEAWLAQVSWDQLINRKGATWRQLPDELKLGVNSDQKAIEIMLEKTSCIRRPLLELNGTLAGMGFEEIGWAKIFGL